MYYRTGEFASRTGVTKRALRYYDRIGLLKPTYRSESDHRLYSEEDFVRLHQIVTLKFIGFSLEQIKNIINLQNVDLGEVLRMQRDWMEGKLQDIQLVIGAIKDAERAVQQGEEEFVYEKIQKIIGVIEMQTNRNWLNELLEAAVSGRLQKANAILAANPDVGDISIYSAVILGKVETVRKMLESDAALAIKQGGPNQWEPILYLSFSCFLKDRKNSDSFAQTMQLLLDYGANPNSFYIQKDDSYERRQTALYGVIGVANNETVAKVLLEAGANPNDGESLYHAAEFPGHTCLDLLYEYGVNINADNSFFRKLDFEDVDGVLWFLEHGVDLNLVLGNEGHTPLHWAVYRGRSVETIELLLKYGADVNKRRTDNKTPYTLAIRLGYTDAAELLRKHGASEDIGILDQFFGACATLDKSKASSILANNPQLLSSLSSADKKMLFDFVELNKKETVEMLLDFGFDKNVKVHGGSVLHFASWFGFIEIVNLLLERGFSLTEINDFGGTPLGSAIHGSIFCNNDGNHASVVEALIQAGAEVPEKADGSKEVYNLLLRYGATK
jgi:DNA-binding transcriptional MerR regulator/ankyrin repeat protein